MWKLVIEDDEGRRTVVPLTRDEYSIGRREGNVIRLTERNVSREHARLYKNGVAYVVEDLTSFNGVFVNGLRISHAQDLAHGDLVQIGDYRIVLQNDAVAAADTTETDSADWKQTLPAVPQTRASELLDRPNRLVMLAGPTPGAEFPLDREKMTIGRAETAAISVNHNSVSRLHCEVHALGDGRFEIVDKGSSNGVRVNGADLRRGIIEPGDLIELGDVRFKFVGAGQVFRPAEGQTLAIIGDREAAESARGRSTSRALPLTLFVLVVAAGAAGAWLSTRPRMRAMAPAASAPSSPEQAALAEASRQCAAGNCETAQARLDSAIPAGSPWRETQEYRQIESAWAESLIRRADEISDLGARRELYQRVAQTMAVDAAHRKIAADRLQQLDSAPASTASALELPAAAAPSFVSTASAAPARAREDGSAIAARSEGGRKPGSTPESSPATGGANAGATNGAATTIEERERQLALAGTPDAKSVLKQQLESRVYAGKASDAEIRLLISTCKDLGDKSCVQQARAVLAQKTQ